MSAFGGKADIAVGVCPLLRSLSGAKRTSSAALHMSANDPKRTSATARLLDLGPITTPAVFSLDPDRGQKSNASKTAQKNDRRTIHDSPSLYRRDRRQCVLHAGDGTCTDFAVCCAARAASKNHRCYGQDRGRSVAHRLQFPWRKPAGQ